MVIDTIVVWGDYYLTTSDAHMISVRNLRKQEFWFKEIIKTGHSPIAPVWCRKACFSCFSVLPLVAGPKRS